MMPNNQLYTMQKTNVYPVYLKIECKTFNNSSFMQNEKFIPIAWN